jgi:HAD superfamily hydrolase (TIGR01490 family)
VTLAIFDLDNTLIAGDSDHAWGEYLVEKGIVDAELYKHTNDQFLHDYQNGNLDIQAYLEFALKPLKAHPISKLHSWRQEFFEHKIKPIMLPKAFELIQSHRDRGDLLMIITATNRFVTEPIARAFAVDTLIATEPEIINQKYTGKVAGIPSFKEGKITRLHQWLEKQHHSIEGAYFYSDSHNDIPLLKLVDNPVAIDPDELLRITCEQHNWPIRSLRN